jgi:hypothetical protein
VTHHNVWQPNLSTPRSQFIDLTTTDAVLSPRTAPRSTHPLSSSSPSSPTSPLAASDGGGSSSGSFPRRLKRLFSRSDTSASDGAITRSLPNRHGSHSRRKSVSAMLRSLSEVTVAHDIKVDDHQATETPPIASVASLPHSTSSFSFHSYVPPPTNAIPTSASYSSLLPMTTTTTITITTTTSTSSTSSSTTASSSREAELNEEELFAWFLAKASDGDGEY